MGLAAHDHTAMMGTLGRTLMRQTLGEDDGGYSSKGRFDFPFRAADARCSS